MDEKEIFELDDQQLYNLFNTKRIEYRTRDDPEDKEILKKLNEEYKKIRDGYIIKFDINTYLTENFIEKPSQGKIIIENKIYKLKDFFTEIEERRANMQHYILETMRDDDSLKPDEE